MMYRSRSPTANRRWWRQRANNRRQNEQKKSNRCHNIVKQGGVYISRQEQTRQKRYSASCM